jgi:hypothetical protein
MTLEERDYAQITERLATDFSGLVPFETIVRILHEQAIAHPDQPADLVEAATRMTLKIRRQGQEHVAGRRL